MKNYLHLLLILSVKLYNLIIKRFVLLSIGTSSILKSIENSSSFSFPANAFGIHAIELIRVTDDIRRQNSQPQPDIIATTTVAKLIRSTFGQLRISYASDLILDVGSFIEEVLQSLQNGVLQLQI